MSYDFTTLSPDDFEHLVADLLSRYWGTRIESFKPGKDGGIDLRNTRTLGGSPSTIVQCKRYAPHKFDALRRSISLERAKLEALRPDKYVLATSAELSPANKDVLIEELKPWCKSPGDIFGPSELNGLLRDFPEIELAHFKLWFSSTAVLERILHSRIFNITQATLDSTRAHLSRIVVHGGFTRALDLLEVDHHVLIVGNPGIGKTTLARIVMCHYMRDGFEPLCVVSNIEDAWNLVHIADKEGRKMVILYDDFLGRLRFDSQRFGKNEEHSLFEFLNKVRRAPQIRLIFTTREYILEDAKRTHGAFAVGADEILKCTLSLADYTRANRAKMLFNHLYFSDLPDSRLSRLLENKTYLEIIQHNHFNPRIVETISKEANSRALSDDDFIGFIQKEFDNPAKIWEHPFRNDISPVAQEILAVLWTFNGLAEFQLLKAAVGALHLDDEREFTSHFLAGIRQLDGNFISTNRYPDRWEKADPHIVVRFQNPSVEEFVEAFLYSESAWLKHLTRTTVCFRQLAKLCDVGTGDRRSFHMDSAFWMALRSSSRKCESIQGGYLINYREWPSGTREVWVPGEIQKVTLVHTLLKIEKQIGLKDKHFLSLQSRVSTSDGWLDLLGGIGNDDSIGYGMTKLLKWINTESRWPLKMQASCREALREAIGHLIVDEDEMESSNIGTLVALAEAITSDGSSLTDLERKALLAAAETLVEVVMDNVDDADAVRGEAEDLTTLAKLCGTDVEAQFASMAERADGLEERKRSSAPAVPPSTRRKLDAGDADNFDVDLLFSGLLDR